LIFPYSFPFFTSTKRLFPEEEVDFNNSFIASFKALTRSFLFPAFAYSIKPSRSIIEGILNFFLVLFNSN
jgi:hypothetical protein